MKVEPRGDQEQGGGPGLSLALSLSLSLRAQELCESRGGRPGLPVPNNPDDFCGRKANTKTGLS